MNDIGSFLQDLAMVMCVAAVTTILFHRLKQPPILGYLLAGLLLGPNVHIPHLLLFAHVETVKTLAQLGVILVMFSIGLDFSIERLLKVFPTAGLTNLIELSFMMWLGYSAGRLMGWTVLESLFAGCIISLASTMIAFKALTDARTDPKLMRVIVGIMVVQDLASILLLAVLTPLAEGAHLSLTGLMMTMGSLLGFLGLLFGIGFLIVPRLIRSVISLRNSETLLVTAIGICFAMALLAQKGGYSVALGAFLAGMLVAESGANVTVQRMVNPLKDMFGAVFFVAVGMLVDPSVLWEHWGSILLLTLLVIVGQTVSVSMGAFLSGRPLKTAIQAGMGLTQIGEFSFIIAQIGVANGAIGGFLYDVTVAVSVVTAFTTPWLIRASEPLSRLVDSRLPRPLQTFTALYGSWLEGLGRGNQEQTFFKRARRLVGVLILDTLFIAGIIITTAATLRKWLPQMENLFHFPAMANRAILVAIGLACSFPFFVGILRSAKTLGGLIAAGAIPTVDEGRVDLGLAPRKVLTVTLQLGIVFAVGLPLLALTQPFIPFGYSPILLAAVVAILGLIFWKSAVNLQGHVQAGAQMVADALIHHKPQNQDGLMEQIDTMVPGIGTPTTLTLREGSPCINKSLGELSLRTRTGASVIAIMRQGDRLLMPAGRVVLQEDDVLVLVGTQEAIFLAKGLLRKPIL